MTVFRNQGREPEAAAANLEAQGAPRLLVIEDDRFLRRACEASLLQRGFLVQTAADGQTGLDLARHSQPDMILLDLLMPRLSGIDVLKQLKGDPSTASIPVVILSNSSREEDKANASNLGAIGYHVKSNLSLRELSDEVNRLLGRPADAGEAGA